jgi:outer membrane receptor protein involved in Fe transport
MTRTGVESNPPRVIRHVPFPPPAGYQRPARSICTHRGTSRCHCEKRRRDPPNREVRELSLPRKTIRPMQMYIRTLLALCLLGAGAAHAQQPGAPSPGGRPGAGPGTAPTMPTGEVRGTVQDGSTLRALGSASVAVHSARDSTLVTGAMTRPDGGFRIEGLRPGRYYLRISYVGYTPRLTDAFAILPNELRADLGGVRLTAAAVQLEGVTATAERSQIELSPDRNTYAVRDMPAAAGGTATDVLRNVPALEVDIDGRVSLRGNQNVAIQINGRAAPMRGDQLAQFLQQLPATMLDRVEVIPNPSARFDPDGMAGIVNIVLRQNADLGTSYGVTVGAGTGDRYNLSGNVGHQQGPLTIFGNYGFFTDERASSGFNFRENRFVTPFTYLEQDVEGVFSPTSHTLNASADYKLSSRDVLSSSLLFSLRDLDNSGLNLYRDFDASGETLGRRLGRTESENDGLTLDYGLGFRRTLQPRTHELSADARFTRNRADALNRFTTETLRLDGSPGGSPATVRLNDLDASTDQWTGQLDYTRPLGGSVRLETGYKGTVRRLANDLDVTLLDTLRGEFVRDTGRSNAFTYGEQVHAGYAVLGRTLGSVMLQGGLRIEQAWTGFDLETTAERFSNDYLSFFPSALASYALGEQRQLRASYSKRIRRPDTGQLNPFALSGGRGPGEAEDELNLFRGNPYLKPEYTHAYELGYQHGGRLGTLQVTPYYRRTTDAVRRVKTIDEGGVSTTTFANLATSDSYGTDVTGSWRLGRFNGFGGINAYRVVTDGSNLETDVSNEAFSWSTRASASWRATDKLDLQSFLMYRAPMDVEMGRISGMMMMHLASRYRVSPSTSLTLRVVDPFNTMRFHFTTSDERHYQESRRSFGARGLFMGLTYNVGQQPRLRQRAPQQDPDQAPQDIGIQ